MQVAAKHRTRDELEAVLADALASPPDQGTLVAIFARPRTDERLELELAELSPTGGLAGDRWATDHWQKLPDGSPDPDSQLSLMSSRVLRLLCGDDAYMRLAGDNLVVDLDLSDENLPPGTRLAIGPVVLELTSVPHRGCGKFARRYGTMAREFVNGKNSRQAQLRGRYAKVIVGGTVRVGDALVKVV